LFTAADGIIGLRLPMPPPLEWINAYFLRDKDGWFMVDTGYNTPESRQVLETMIANHLDGLPIKGVIVTHYHPDHSGQAGWLIEKFKCPLYMTQTEFLLARWLSTDNTPSYRQMVSDYYRYAGAPETIWQAIVERGNSFLRSCDELPPKYFHLQDKDTLVIGGRIWRVVIGRGHAPEMIMLYDETSKLLISADQVVARITPNISIWAFDTKANPLKDFMESSDYLPKIIPNDVTVLPGHGRPFDNFHERIGTYNPFHEKRLQKLREGLTDEPQSLYQLLKILFVKDLSPRDFVFAMGETHSHINYLLAEKQAVRLPGPEMLYKKI
jgi:glyoxylase-like metal-dependent hydrolase (beta-lactamase superfamily II)